MGPISKELKSFFIAPRQTLHLQGMTISQHAVSKEKRVNITSDDRKGNAAEKRTDMPLEMKTPEVGPGDLEE